MLNSHQILKIKLTVKQYIYQCFISYIYQLKLIEWTKSKIMSIGLYLGRRTKIKHSVYKQRYFIYHYNILDTSRQKKQQANVFAQIEAVTFIKNFEFQVLTLAAMKKER